MTRTNKLCLLILAVALGGWTEWANHHAPPLPGPDSWRPGPALSAAAEQTPVFKRGFVDAQEPVTSVHAATICELPSGRLCAAWYGGTRELASDVAIYFATRGRGEAEQWSAPRAIVTSESAMAETARFVNKVGNSLVFADAQGRLRLLYVSIALGRWSGSTLNLKTSVDEGETWSRAQRLTLSPFLNLSELVRNKPFFVSDQVVAIPVYQEFLGRFPEVLWLSCANLDSTPVFSKQRIAKGNAWIQPSVVWTGAANLRAFLRDCTKGHTIAVAESTDGAHSWQNPRPTSLPNPNSGLDALRLSNSQLLLMFNDLPAGRDNLRLAISSDGGQTWRRAGTLEDEPGAEFSYPCAIQDRAGRVHVVYSWKRQHIEHVVFNTAWLEQQAAASTHP